MIELVKDVDIFIPIRLETAAGADVTGKVAADLTIQLANKASVAWELLTPTTHYTLAELGEGDYTLKILAAPNDTFGGLRVKVADDDSTGTAVTKQYVIGVNRLGNPTSIFDPAADEVDIGKVKGVGVAGVNDFKADVSALATSAALATVDTVVDAIKAVTDLLPDAGALNDLAAILTDTGTTLPAQIAALNNLSQAQAEAASLSALITYDPPTNAEMLAAFVTTDGLITTVDTVVDAIKAVTDLLPNGGALSDLAAILTDTGTTLPAQIAALNNISQVQVEAACDAALATYDGPTNAEMIARTLIAASYATAAALTAAQTDITVIRVLRQNRIEFDLTANKAFIYNDAGTARQYEADLTDDSGGGVTTATSGPINCSKWTLI